MKSKSVEGLPADPQESLAANEEFADELDVYTHLIPTPAGWDPYDVWRTRVKNASRSGEHEADPRR